MSIYQRLYPLLDLLDPETAHGLSLRAMGALGAITPLRERLRRSALPPGPGALELMGLSFQNPIGLAAGYDKDGRGWRGLAALGFGHIEVGTVTPRPQLGNPRPRIFRLREDGALINRLGFPGKGSDAVAKALTGPRPKGLILGVNIGKNKDTPNERASEDYLALLPPFAPLADYLVVNVSSPNTQGLRHLQARDALEALISALVGALGPLRESLGKPLPLLVKLAPDLDSAALEAAVGAAVEGGISGIVATNTTVSREGLKSVNSREMGGLSGAPLEARSTETIQQIHRLSGGALPIIGVGGVMGVDDAQRKLDAGASLVQIYTGLVYGGPGLVRELIRGVA